MDEETTGRRFVDSNVFLYVIQGHPTFGPASRDILERIDTEEHAVTATINMAEVCWWLEKQAKPQEIASTIRLLSSIINLDIVSLTMEDFHSAARLQQDHHIDFNDCLSLAVMHRLQIDTIYSNDTDFDRAEVTRVFE